MMAPCFGHRRLIAASTDTRAKCHGHGTKNPCPQCTPVQYAWFGRHRKGVHTA